jgi:hypothetical protein
MVDMRRVRESDQCIYVEQVVLHGKSASAARTWAVVTGWNPAGLRVIVSPVTASFTKWGAPRKRPIGVRTIDPPLIRQANFVPAGSASFCRAARGSTTWPFVESVVSMSYRLTNITKMQFENMENDIACLIQMSVRCEFQEVIVIHYE